jgi:hypothetical protein
MADPVHQTKRQHLLKDLEQRRFLTQSVISALYHEQVLLFPR